MTVFKTEDNNEKQIKIQFIDTKTTKVPFLRRQSVSCLRESYLSQESGQTHTRSRLKHKKTERVARQTF